MVVVTGAPRSGTSLMMRTLMNNGYHVRPGTVPVVHEHMDMIMPTANATEDKEEAAKIFGNNLNCLSPIENIDAVIVCIRNPMDAFLSWMKWTRPTDINGHLDKKYIAHYSGLDAFVHHNPKIPIAVVDFDDWKKDEAAVIAKLEKLLGITKIKSQWSTGDNEMTGKRNQNDVSMDSYHMRVKDETRIKEIIKISKKLKKKR